MAGEGHLVRDIASRVRGADDEDGPGLKLCGAAVVRRVELPDSGIEVGGEVGSHGPVVLEDAGRNDDVVGLEPAIAGTDDVSVAVLLHGVDAGPGANGQLEALGVRLEVVGHLPRGRERLRRSGEPHAGKPVEACRGVQPERGPALPPRVSDSLTRIEDDEGPASLLQVVAGGQSRLAAADDHRLEALYRLSRHCCLLQLTLIDGRRRRDRAHRADPPTSRGGAWLVLTTRPGSDEVVLERESAGGRA